MKLAVWVLVSILASGCVQLSAGPKGSSVAAPIVPRAEVTDELGGMEGFVVDPEQIPVPGAQVGILGTNMSVNTTSAGAFAFSGLAPQQYFLVVKHATHRQKQVGVEVVAGGVKHVLVVVEPVPPPTPYLDEGYSFTGLFGAALCVDAQAARPCQTSSSGTAIPEEYRTKLASGFKVQGGWNGVLFETAWQPSTFLATQLNFTLIVPEHVSGNACQFSRKLVNVAGTSPLRLVLTRADHEQRRIADDSLCDLSPGGAVSFQVDPYRGTSGVGVFVDQRFTVYATVAYNGPLPDGYTRIP